MNLYKKEKPLTSFVLPNESYKWDFILDKFAAEHDAEREGATERQETEHAGGKFDEARVTTRRRRELHDRHTY